MHYSRSALAAFCAEALQAARVGREDAETVARVLTSADERGVSSHGCVRMEGYVECLLSGGIRPDAVCRFVAEGPSSALLDAGQGLGIPVSVRAAELAIEKAKQTGVGVVNVRGSHHHGACGYYSLMCARQGLLGLAMSTGDTIMAATGSASRCIGNNPFSYAVPAGKYGNICYDVAMSTVAAGKISMAGDEGRSIPLGWLLDAAGNPTTDPADYERGGPLVPFGGYKGYGLSMMVESLAGILSGAALLKDIHAWNKDPTHGGNVGHCFIALDPRILNPGFSVPARAEQMIEELSAAPKAPGAERICFPGQIEQEREAASRKAGICLPPAAEHALERVSAMVPVAFVPDAMRFEFEK